MFRSLCFGSLALELVSQINASSMGLFFWGKKSPCERQKLMFTSMQNREVLFASDDSMIHGFRQQVAAQIPLWATGLRRYSTWPKATTTVDTPVKFRCNDSYRRRHWITRSVESWNRFAFLNVAQIFFLLKEHPWAASRHAWPLCVDSIAGFSPFICETQQASPRWWTFSNYVRSFSDVPPLPDRDTETIWLLSVGAKCKFGHWPCNWGTARNENEWLLKIIQVILQATTSSPKARFQRAWRI